MEHDISHIKDIGDIMNIFLNSRIYTNQSFINTLYGQQRKTTRSQDAGCSGTTGVGSTYNFIYNTKTGKLSTKDGSKNEFVDFCNGDVKGEDTETLNHFDEHTRYQFTRMLYAYGTGMTGQNPFADDEEVEITADIDSATER